MRIGYGWDSHEFKPGIPLKIGGVTLPHDQGLGGHSDGDVLLHAITDALLGAIAGPDIGSLFPPSDPQWKNADSAVFLREALAARQDRWLRTRESGFHADPVRSKNRPARRSDSQTSSRVVRNSRRLRRHQSQNAGRHGHGKRRDCECGGLAETRRV